MTDMITKLKCTYNGIKTRPPCREEQILSVKNNLGIPNKDLINLYRETNGLVYEWFEVFPMFDKQNSKNTWNSIERVNDLEKSPYLKGKGVGQGI
jgi:hypothetical protein